MIHAIARTLFASLALTALDAPALAQGGPPAASVRVDPVKEKTVDRRRNVTGEVRAARRSNVAAEASGLVLEMPVEVGDQLDKGDLIARLDDTLTHIEVTRREAEVDAAEALIDERKALVEKAQRDVNRIEALRARNSASQSELDDAKTELATATAQLAQAKADLATSEADLDQAREQLEDMTLRAPFAGSIVRRDIEVGQWINVGVTALELIELQRVDVYLDVPELFINTLAETERPITMRFADGRITRDAPWTAIIDDADPQARTFPVRVRLDNTDGALRPGMSVTGVIPTGELITAITVHKDAVLRDDAGAYVYYVSDGKATPARIVTLFAVDNRYAVRSGQLRPGMKLITEGNERLYPTQPVEVIGNTDDGTSDRDEEQARTPTDPTISRGD